MSSRIMKNDILSEKVPVIIKLKSRMRGHIRHSEEGKKRK